VVVKAVIDTSAVIEALDKGRGDLLKELVEGYEELLIPWVVVYEYTMGHRLLGRDPWARKQALEELGSIVWMEQELLLKAQELDVELRRRGRPIPFSDVLVAATALAFEAELVTLDEHFREVEGLRLRLLEEGG